MQQSRLSSFIEALLNVAIGYGIALAVQLFIFPIYGFEPSLSDNIEIGAFFTVVSIIRSYAVRRWFNARLHRAALILAGENQ